jgi:hypothetical protein
VLSSILVYSSFTVSFGIENQKHIYHYFVVKQMFLSSLSIPEYVKARLLMTVMIFVST